MRYSTVSLKIALVGNGAIARQIAHFCAAHRERFEIVAALAPPSDKMPAGAYFLTQSLNTLLAAQPGLVVECAGHAAASAYGPTILRSGVNLILVSVGSLSDERLYTQMCAAARDGGAQLRLPAGALPGVDALAAAKFAGLDFVELRSTKPPVAWSGTPAEDICDLNAIAVPTVIFHGNAREAARRFPKNANVAATAALAGIGFERTNVSLVADPGAEHNSHHLEAQGAFGRMVLAIEAKSSPENPKSSLIAGLSVIRLLEHQSAGIIL